MPNPSRPDTDYVCRGCSCRVKGLAGYGVLPSHVMQSKVDLDCDVEAVRGIMES